MCYSARFHGPHCTKKPDGFLWGCKYSDFFYSAIILVAIFQSRPR